MGIKSEILSSELAKIFSNSKLTEEERKNLQLEVESLLIKSEPSSGADSDMEVSAKEKILLAELNQEDLFTRRARPMVVYAGLGFIFLNYCLIPGLQYIRGKAEATCIKDGKPDMCAIEAGINLPEEFWWAWGSIVSTWTIGRSFEKARAGNRITQAITGSTTTTTTTTDEAKG